MVVYWFWDWESLLEQVKNSQKYTVCVTMCESTSFMSQFLLEGASNIYNCPGVLTITLVNLGTITIWTMKWGRGIKDTNITPILFSWMKHRPSSTNHAQFSFLSWHFHPFPPQTICMITSNENFQKLPIRSLNRIQYPTDYIWFRRYFYVHLPGESKDRLTYAPYLHRPQVTN